MHFRDDEELFSIGAMALVNEVVEHDTTSDGSDWVLQYADWEEGVVQFEFTPLTDLTSKVGPVFQASLPGRKICVLPRTQFVQVP